MKMKDIKELLEKYDDELEVVAIMIDKNPMTNDEFIFVHCAEKATERMKGLI